MKKIIVTFAAIVMIAGLSNRVFSQAASTSGAKILAPISVELLNSSVLHFGTLANSAAGTVILSPANVRTVGTVVGLPQAPVNTVPLYKVTGTPAATFGITLPADDYVYLAGDATKKMPVTTWTTSLTDNKGQLAGDGTLNFTMGASLGVTLNQPGGIYAGTFSVTVVYN